MNKNIIKVLFIADEIPQTINAGSIQFYRLFKNYPPENLMVIGREPTAGATTLYCEYHTLKNSFADRLRISRFHKMLPAAEALGLIDHHLPQSLAKVADGFRPDVVISLMQLYMYYRPAYHYARSRKLPLVLFCHDDTEAFSSVPESLKQRLIKKNAEVYRYASRRICISPEMASAWAEKYGVEGEHMYPLASDQIQPRPAELNTALRNPDRLTLGFAGSLAYGYREGIQEIIPFLEKEGHQLNIYREPDDQQHSPSIAFRGFAPTAEETWQRIQQECDAVILPYSFEEKFRPLYSTHFPSKLTEYAGLGMPVIVRGPAYATGVKWASNRPNYHLVSDGSSLGWKEEVKHLFQSILHQNARVPKSGLDFDESTLIFDKMSFKTN